MKILIHSDNPKNSQDSLSKPVSIGDSPRFVKGQGIYGMARAGYVGELELYVNTDDAGEIPHFHLRSRNGGDGFHSCIKLGTPEYFSHGSYKNTLNHRQKKALQEFMLSPVTLSKYRDKFKNNWELLCFLWEINNSEATADFDAQPDYTKLP